MFPAPTSDVAADDLRGIQIRVTDPALQAYMQRYPFASGPDEALNRKARDQAAAGMYFRAPGPSVVPVQLGSQKAKLPATEEARALQILSQAGLSPEQCAEHLQDFGWETNFAPRDARNVLVLGCGDGVELVFLRAVLPQARITAVDYHDSILPGIKDAVGLTLLVGDMHEHLLQLQPEFDLVYSNHTLEHMYDPDRTLSMLLGLLVPNGRLVSVFPMMASRGTPFLEKVRTFVQLKEKRPQTVLPLAELVYFDLGHPWKTNPSDVMATMLQAGFHEVQLYQRADHPCRPAALSGDALSHARAAAVAGNRRLLAPLHWIAKLPELPLPLRKLIFALERRVSFGTNRVMNEFSEEVLVVGRKA